MPLIKGWQTAAATDAAVIKKWWGRWPHALIGTPTGARTRLAVLDIDMKAGRNGLRSLAKLLGTEDKPITPTALTPTGGLHLYFTRPEGGFGNTTGAAGRGIGEGLDWRCDGGLVVLPAPGTGYIWGEHSYATCAPIAVPAVLLPRRIDADTNTGTGRPIWLRSISISSLSGVVRTLAAAAEGERNSVLFWSACRFGEAIAQGLIDEDDARRILAEAADRLGLPNREIARTITSAFSREA